MSQGFLPAARFAQCDVHKRIDELHQQPLADGEVIQRLQVAHVMIPSHRLNIAFVKQVSSNVTRSGVISGTLLLPSEGKQYRPKLMLLRSVPALLNVSMVRQSGFRDGCLPGRDRVES